MNAYLKDIFKDIIQELLEAELEAKLGYAKDDIESKNTDNSRNGEFQPKIIPKYQRNVSGIEEKVISLYARGMSTRDIS